MGKPKEKDDAMATHTSGQSNTPLSAPAHALTHAQLAAELGVDALSGLSAEEAKARLESYGRNELGEAEGVQPLKIVAAQIANAMTLVKPLVFYLVNKKTELI
jgi:magnesium-transporting ATPase (P-type)